MKASGTNLNLNENSHQHSVDVFSSQSVTEVWPNGSIHPSQSESNSYVIELVPADRNWILERLAQEIQKAASFFKARFDVQIVSKPTGTADLVYYLPYSVQKPVEGCIVGSWFTHKEDIPEASAKFFKMALEADLVICPAKKYQKLLQDQGVIQPEMVYHGVDLDIYRPKLRIGVVGRTYHTGRKGEDLFASLLDIEDVEFQFTGEGWPLAPIHCSAKDLADFYRNIDYLLIPSRIEGGPVPLFEALACGTEVISADVGCVEDFPHIPFANGDAADLRRVIIELRDKKFALGKSVETLSWSRFGQEHLRIFSERIENIRPANFVHRKTPKLSSLPQIILVSHGSEDKNKGGPTTRMALIQKTYEAIGGRIQVSNEVNEVADLKDSICHVFNSWPLKSAITQIEKAKSRCSKTVYSPIALNLSHRPVFQRVIPSLLERAKTNQELLDALASIPSQTSPWQQSSRPKQGVPDHFISLAKGVAIADGVIFLSEYERNFIHSLGVKPRHERVIHNAIESDIIAAADGEEFVERFGVKDFVLMVGRIETRKNQALTAFALRNLNIPVVAIGHVTDEKYFRSVKRWAGPNFVHIDRIENRRLLGAAYKAARCLVLGSWSEGAPLVALEGAAAGTPMVLSEMSSEQEYFGSWAEYVHPADIKDIQAKVEKIISNPESSSEREARSRYFADKYNIQKHVRETLEFYQETTDLSTENINGIHHNLSPNLSSQISLQTKPNIIDITHLAHTTLSKKPLTGVTSVEKDLLFSLIQQQADTALKFVVWNTKKNAYMEASLAQVQDGSFASLAKASSLSKVKRLFLHVP